MGRASFDVIVAGGGPAGATAAYCLATAGVRVAIVDGARFPRDKTCGGGLTSKVVRYLPVDAKPVIRNVLFGIRFSYRFGDRFMKRHPEPIVYGILRREFDSYLVEQATRQGATLLEGTRVTGYEQAGEGKIRVATDAGPMGCEVLIGADGANGVVRRILNPEEAFFTQAGLSFEIGREKIREERVDDDLMRVDWGTLPSGYAWIFPKGESFNIGVGGPVMIARSLRRYLGEFLRSERVLRREPAGLDDLGVSGHKLPSLTEKTRLVEQDVLVIGDAAGFIEPLAGDGISYGVQSARLAVDAVLRRLSGSSPDLSEYRDAVLREIVPEIASSRMLLRFFNTFPQTVHEAVRDNDRVWHAFCRVLRGDEGYDALPRRKMGRLYGLLGYIYRLTERYEARRLGSASVRATIPQRIIGLILRVLLQRI